MRSLDVYLQQQRRHEQLELHWYGHIQPVWARFVPARSVKSTALLTNEGPAQAGPFFLFRGSHALYGLRALPRRFSSRWDFLLPWRMKIRYSKDLLAPARAGQDASPTPSPNTANETASAVS